jgi:hypothetical protein
MTYYSYTKMNLLDGFLVAIVLFIVFYLSSIGIFKVFTLNYIFKGGQQYDDAVNKEKPEKVYIQPKEDNKIDANDYKFREQIGFYNVMEMYKNINGAFFSAGNNNWKTVFKLKFLPKLYFILLSTVTLVTLLKLVVNYTINICIMKTIQTDVRVAPVGQDSFKPGTSSIYSSVAGMGLQYIGIVLLFLIPTIYCYIAFNINWFRNLNKIIKRIVTLCVFIPVLVYGVINLFSNGFFENDFTSTENNSKNFLKSAFNSQDYDFPDSIYNTKNTFVGNYGIWFVVFIVFFIFEYKIINRMKIKTTNFIMKILVVGLMLFAFSLFISFRHYGNTDPRNAVFRNNMELRPQMYKHSVNNIKQAIVKYNYPCMPFGKN